MKRAHEMPFGAQMVERSTRFRLWAPAAKQVDLELTLQQVRKLVSMQPLEDGWFEATVAEVPAGARYAMRIDGGILVPDPAARFNPEDVHGASELIDPLAHEWTDADWRGRPWHEAVIYELHLGTFTPAGTARAAIDRLDDLAALGVTAIELMPVAAFAGRRNWGYDGVLPFAPAACYGRPEELKELVAAAHARSLMVFLDVVYNHFGPEGNYLHSYAPDFFDPGNPTPWGPAINFDGPNARTVRDFFIHNALYWIEEFHFDGLRLDAVHAIVDDSQTDIVAELIEAVRTGPGQTRHVHVILENDANEADRIGYRPTAVSTLADAQWNDDLHHAMHVLVTSERDGYYADYAQNAIGLCARALAEGFAYQGEASAYRGGVTRGNPSVHLPATAFVAFLQSHDQVGNRALGHRIAALAEPECLELALSCVLLAPAIPMLFMGEEYAASSPFLFFCDFGPDLAEQVDRGRREEFKRFAQFGDAAGQATIPSPNAPSTFEVSKLDWDERRSAGHREWLERYRKLLQLRASWIVPRLPLLNPPGRYELFSDLAFGIDWSLADGSSLALRANFSAEPLRIVPLDQSELIHSSKPMSDPTQLPAVAALWTVGKPT